MDRPALTIITDDATSGSFPRWRDGLSRDWPAGVRPAIEHLPLADLLAAARELTANDLVLVLTGPDTTPALLGQIESRLTRTNTPGVVLIPARSTQRPVHLSLSSLLAEPDSIAPRELALVLATLGRRQASVIELAQELALVRTATGGMARAMETIRDEMQLAASVQREFLPHALPSCDGLDSALLFRPAGFVSGDVYDITAIDEHIVAFFLGDAIGHGVPAALLTIMLCQGLVRTEPTASGSRILPPDETLTRLNTALCDRQFESARFATAVYGLLDTSTGSVTLAGAGHPPPLVISQTEARPIETTGPLLGIFPDAEFACARFVLEPGQTLLLYSDGFELALPGPDGTPGSTHHRSELAQLVASTLKQGLPLDHAMAAIGRALDQQAGSLHQGDDLTALALGRPTGVGRSSAAAMLSTTRVD